MAAMAETDLFYYDHSIAELDAAIKEENTQAEIYRFAKYWIEKNGFSKGEADINQISFNYDEILPYYFYWTKENLKEFDESPNKKEMLQQYAKDNPSRVVYDVPCYYQNERIPFYARFIYDKTEGKYKYYQDSFPQTTLEEMTVTMVNENKEMLTKKLEQEEYLGYTPQVAINVGNIVFILLEKDGQYTSYCIGSEQTFERNPQLNEVLSQKLTDLPELYKICAELDAKQAAEYEKQKAAGILENDKENTTPSAEANGSADLTLLWIVGGAALLIGGVLTVILVKKRR